MLIKFLGNDSTLDSKPFIDEEVQFNLLHLIRESKSPLLFTNKNRSIIIGQSDYKYPAWIWTSNQISNEEIEELKNDFINLYKDNNRLTFVAKPHIAKVLAEHYSEYTNRKYSIYLQMESYKCQSAIEPKEVPGYLRKAVKDDIDIISEFLAGFSYNCFGKITTPNQQIENANMYIESGKLYVWCNDDEIISMANIAHDSKRNTRINEVYTKIDKRGEGFGARIVYELCKIIINEHKVPVLYTDLTNPASNKAYKKVGFMESGKITQILFD